MIVILDLFYRDFSAIHVHMRKRLSLGSMASNVWCDSCVFNKICVS